MSLGDYVLNGLLVALVVRQIRGRRLTVLGLAWPVLAVGLAAVTYLRDVPTAGDDLELVLGGAFVGAVLGCLCGAYTRIHRVDGGLLAKATGVAAVLWVLGIGARMAFALYATHGGAPEIARFSADHAITGAAAWTACLVLMSLTEVVGRTVVLGARAALWDGSNGGPTPATPGSSRRSRPGR